jgi:Ca-activated chloride channel family protein
MSSGIDLAYRMAKAAFVPNSENRVIVLSDGDANVGPASHEQILRQIREYAGQGITLTTIGFGMGNYKDTMMEQLANKGDGNYYYIDSFNEAKRVFGKNLAGTVQTVARDVKLQVEFNEEDVYAYRLIGYENRDVADRDFRNDEVDAGEIGSGHTVTALYEVVFRDGWSDTFGTVRVRAKRPGRDTAAKEWATPMKASHVAKSIQHTSRDFRIAAAVGSFAELLRGSPYLPETTFAEVEALARSARRAQFNEDLELIELIATAGRLKGEKGVHVTTR